MTRSNVKISSGMATVFSIAAGLAVGNLYWAQPLLAAIAGDLGASLSQGGYLVTATQLGYALGILLIVPLGDILDRRRLLSIIMVLTTCALFACAFAPSFAILLIALGAMGLVTVSGQIILPLVGDLAEETMLGRMVGIVSSGITAGILFSRLLSGLVADLWDWRSIYLLAAVLNLIMVAVIRICLPGVPAQGRIPYGKLLLGVFTAVKRYPEIRGIMLKQGMIFGMAFNLFWTALTFLLSAHPFSYSTFQIGLVSLAGLTGAVAGTRLGILQDKGLGQKGMAFFMGMSAISMGVAAIFKTSIVAILLAAALFSLAVQGVGILCQSQLFTLSDSERSRLNTVFVVSNFLFCAAGSCLATFLWDLGGGNVEMAGAVIASLAALGVHFCSGRIAGHFKASPPSHS
ncbi:MAG: MFS transporter [Mailhella sp.]|nr:MFS transporter [Mailhella sp.]